MNIDGSDRRQLTFGDEDKAIASVSFSPDGKHIAYSTLVNDSVKIKLIDFPNPGTPKIIHAGIVLGWVDNNNMFAANVNGTPKTWEAPINGDPVTQIGQDSTFALHIENDKYVFYEDVRKGREGIWIKTEGSKSKLLIPDNKVKFMSLSVSRFFYYETIDGTLWRLHLPDGRKEKLQGSLPNLTDAFSFSSSNDGKLIVYINHQSRGKLVMIDNLFK